MEGTGANLRLPLNPPFFFESAVSTTTRRPVAGTLTTGFAELRPLDQPSGHVRAWDPNLRPQFTQQWNVFAEYLLTPSMSANIGYVGHNADHLVTPVEGNQPLAGVGDPSRPGCRRNSAVRSTRRPRSSPTSRPPPRAAAATTTRCRSSLRQRIMQRLRVPGVVHAEPDKTNNLGYYGRAASPPRAPTG